MAITKVIEIDVDELKALGGLDNLNKAVQQTDKSTASLKTQIKEATIELVNAQKEFGDYSEAALNAAKKVATLKDQIAEAQETAKLFDPGAKFQAATGAIAAGANAIQGYQSSLGLLGVEGEAAQETLLKVQSAMALSQSLSGIADSAKDFKRLAAVAQQYTIVQKAITAGQWLWNAAQAANPIGAIIAAVVALIAAGVALTKYFIDNSEAAKQNSAAVEQNRVALENQTKTLERNSEQFDKKQKQELAMAKASGMSAEAIRKLELKLIDEKIAYEKSQRAIAENTYQKNLNTLASLKAAGADEEVIKKQQETANESIKQFNKQNQDVRKALDEKKDIQNRHLVEIKTAEVSSAKENEKRRKEERDKARQELRDQQKKDLEEIKKIQQEAVKANDDSVLTEREKELNDLKIKNDAKLALLKKYGKDTTELELQILNEQNEINLKYDEQERNRVKEQKAKDDKEAEDKKAKDQEKKLEELELNKEFEALTFEEQREILTERENTLLQDKTLSEEQRKELEKQYADARIEIAEKEKKAKLLMLDAISGGLSLAADELGESTAAGKAAAVASATISTYTAIAGQLAAFSNIPVPGYAIAQAIVTGVAGLLQVKKILSVKTPKGGGGGGGSVPSNISGGGGTTAAPTFNVVGNSGVNQIANTLGGTQPPIQAYVVANNVTTQQSLDRNIVSNASLG
jgi:chromosome segregation ATPase